MSSFIRSLKRTNDAIGLSRPVTRALALVGEDPKPDAIARPRPESLREFLDQVRDEAPRDIEDGTGTVAGAIAGAALWGEHRVLGFIGGASLGRNLPALLDREKRPMALTNMAATGGGITGSLLWRAHPVIGHLIGHALVNAFTFYAGWRR